MPENGVNKNREFVVRVKDNAALVEALATVDMTIFTNPTISPFNDGKQRYIRSYLQLFWNPEENEIYPDINVFGAGTRGFLPIKKNIQLYHIMRIIKK